MWRFGEDARNSFSSGYSTQSGARLNLGGAGGGGAAGKNGAAGGTRGSSGLGVNVGGSFNTSKDYGTGVNWGKTSESGDSYGHSLTNNSERANGENLTGESGTYARSGGFSRNDIATSSDQSWQQRRSEADSYTREAARLHELSVRLNKEADFSERHDFSLSENLTPELQSFYQQQQAEFREQGKILPDIRDTSTEGLAAKRLVFSRFADQYVDKVRQEANIHLPQASWDTQLKAPNVVPLRPVGSFPRSLVPSRPAPVLLPAQAPGVASRISAGKTELGTDRAAAEAQYNNSRLGGSDVRSTVEEPLSTEVYGILRKR